jgi:hypothetical protein
VFFPVPWAPIFLKYIFTSPHPRMFFDGPKTLSVLEQKSERRYIAHLSKIDLYTVSCSQNTQKIKGR